MSINQVHADILRQNQELVKKTLADFSDADMMARPCPGANHAAWQLGHVIAAETHLANKAVPGALPELPAGFAEKFGKGTSASDDAGAFGTKAELLGLFDKTRAASIKWAESLTPAELEKVLPEELHRFAKTVAHMVEMLPLHATMHVGQMQVIRRKLGKPILF